MSSSPFFRQKSTNLFLYNETGDKMKGFDSTVLNIILVVMPVLMYLLYSAYVKITNKKEEKIIFSLALFTQIYLIIKYSYDKTPIFLINIPLLIAYDKNKEKLILVLSVSIILYLSMYENVLLLLIKYVLIYFFYKIKNENVIIFFIILNIIEMILYKYLPVQIIVTQAVLYTVSSFVIYLLQKGENITNIHIQIKELEKEERIKKSLFQITHEIKNPIAVCKGYLDMYDRGKDFNKYIPIIKEEIDRTLILLEDFLAMNKQKINKDILDINMLLEDVINNMEMIIENKNIDLDLDISDDEIYINGDYNRLMQVLINIFKNSIEALEKKKNPKIKVWTENKDNYIDIFIKDNGVGINKDIINKIKEPFYTTKIKGTGLGVSLSDEIIKAHKGTLNYKSEEDKYTLVNIKLPLEQI